MFKMKIQWSLDSIYRSIIKPKSFQFTVDCFQLLNQVTRYWSLVATYQLEEPEILDTVLILFPNCLPIGPCHQSNPFNEFTLPFHY